MNLHGRASSRARRRFPGLRGKLRGAMGMIEIRSLATDGLPALTLAVDPAEEENRALRTEVTMTTIFKHIRAIVLLPVVATIVIPAAIIAASGPGSVGWSAPFPFGFVAQAASVLLIGLGVALMVNTIALFVRLGRGTLAPWDPTQRLVVRGVYRYVRNPMISGVFCVLLGEAVALKSIHLFGWFVLFVALNLIYIPLVEEPRLERRFGTDYVQYKRDVPRWIPRPGRRGPASRGRGE
jgi:protein-S-isoprenylcysteine O-methyltransferase Ste14